MPTIDTHNQPTVVISKERLLELLGAEHELKALNGGGVDNWQWYSEVTIDYIDEYNDEHSTNCEWFDDIAKDELEREYCK